MSGHLGREKTYQTVSQTFWWPCTYKWVANYVKRCETCQRVKPSGHTSAPLQSLPVPADCWKSMSLDFVFGLPADDRGNTGILVFVCRLSKMVHLARVSPGCTAVPRGVLRHPVPASSDQVVDVNCGPQPDGQTERVNRVLEDTLRNILC
ncbi:Inositol-3-phosphate synthase [Phytophthora palmivora]|uniref:Inositol-3-phosphate synthase n=1 Tax=Phytophthora palmivora TaxID=4796 RepID=A0A2P4X0D5_9STRA|nr:Inositol-3-phosphate synthase [Phytophthora palmivora]